MATIRYKELRKRYELDGAAQTVQHLSEALDKGQLKPEDFSIRDLAEGLIPDGHLWVRELDPRSSSGMTLTESIEGIDINAFSNITGRVIQSRMLESYRHDAFTLSNLVDTIPSRFETERIPGVTPIQGNALEIPTGMPYPNLGFSENYVDTPRTTKRGLIVSVTKEAIFFDQTHLILSRAADVGEILGLNKERRILSIVLGLKNEFKWNGKAYNTYYPKSATSPPWINVCDNNELVDWKNVDAVENVFGSMMDTATNEPALIEPNTVLIMPQKKQTAAQIFQTNSIMFSSEEQAAMSSYKNPYGKYNVISSRLAVQELLKSGLTNDKAQLYWYMGNFRKAFGYMENWPITVTQTMGENDANFNNDIVVRYKASERGAATVLNPRYVVRSVVP